MVPIENVGFDFFLNVSNELEKFTIRSTSIGKFLCRHAHFPGHKSAKMPQMSIIFIPELPYISWKITISVGTTFLLREASVYKLVL